MSIFQNILPFEKIQVESKHNSAEISTRMNWFIQTPFRGGELNGVLASGYANDQKFFFEYLNANGRKGVNQYAGTVNGNKFWFFVRLKKDKKILLLILFGLGFLSALVTLLSEPDGINQADPILGGMGVLYLFFLLWIKSETKATKKFIFNMLEARKIN